MRHMLRYAYLSTAALAAAFTLPLGTAAAQTLTTVYAFPGKDLGEYPASGVTAIGANLYGTTTFGGTYNGGTVFKYTPSKSNSLVTLAALPLPAQVNGSLLSYKGLLYGISPYGGSGQYGVLFSVNPATKALTILHSFSGSDGGVATAPLTQVKGVLYGTTSIGGVGQGNIFTYEIATKKFTTIHTFGGDAPYYPANPEGGLVQIGGYLYGTTDGGGAYNNGTVFKLDLANRAVSVIYNFQASVDGGFPVAGLTVVNGLLYGAASGTYNKAVYTPGSIFSLDPKKGKETTLYTFTGGADGSNPVGQLINVNGTLYGTTELGGANKQGTVFTYNIATKTQAVVHSFAGTSDGAFPTDTLANVSGVLYGTTEEGGASNFGTLFKLTLPAKP